MTAPDTLGLEVRDLTVRFGGNTAVDRFTFDAPLHRLTGLIGPNGAGKTSTFGAISGLIEPAGGTVRFLGHDLTRAAAPARARLGLGRTFQRTELCPSLTVRENVALAPEARAAGSNPWRQVVPRRRDRAAIDDSVDRSIEMCDLAHLAHQRVEWVTVGQRRLVELARALAGDYRLLLLDEPSSGLDPDETDDFGSILRTIVDHGVGVLLVEHDMTLVMGVCDYLYTLDFGTRIFAGTPAETRASIEVRAAYLGTDTAEPTAVN